jgi:PEP-CTERM motif
MRRSRLLLGLALAGAALAGGAQAATVTLKVSGTYTAEDTATVPTTGPVSGFLTFDATPQLSGPYAIFALESADITFGLGPNSFDLVAGLGQTNYLVQSSDYNAITVFYGGDPIELSFGLLAPDITHVYDFSDTPVKTAMIFQGGAFGLAQIFGGYGPQGLDNHRVPTVNLTLTTVPEPATWAFMTLGYGLAGAALRRRRAQPLAA